MANGKIQLNVTDRNIIIIIIIKQSLKRKRPSRKYVVFREVLHRNKKVLKTKNRKYKCHRSKSIKYTIIETTKTTYRPKN